MDRRTASMPLPESSRRPAAGGTTPELYAALSRRLRIVEGSCGSANQGMKAAAAAVAASVAEAVAQARSPSPQAQASSNSRQGSIQGTPVRAASSSMPLEGHLSRRLMQGHSVQLPPGGPNGLSPVRGQQTFSASPGAPPPPCSGGNTPGGRTPSSRALSPANGAGSPASGTRYSSQNGNGPAGTRPTATTPRTSNVSGLTTERMRKHTWPRQGTPQKGGASPNSPMPGSADLAARHEALLAACNDPSVIDRCHLRVPPGQPHKHRPHPQHQIPLQHAQAPVGEAETSRITVARAWRTSRENHEPIQLTEAQAAAAFRSAEARVEDALMAQRKAENAAAHAAEKHLVEQKELKARNDALEREVGDLEVQLSKERLEAEQAYKTLELAEARNAALQRDVAALQEQLRDAQQKGQGDEAAQVKELKASNAALQQDVAVLKEHLVNAKREATLEVHTALLQRSNSDLEAYHAQMKEEVQKRDRMHAEMIWIRKERDRAKKENEELVEANRALRRQVQEFAVAGLRAGGRSPKRQPSKDASPVGAGEEQQRYAQQQPHLQSPPQQQQQQQQQQQGSSEGRLRAALARGGATTTAELADCVNAVEALLGEAKRELGARQLRERRAAFEALHAAIEGGDEAVLAEAVQEARRTEVDAEDVERGEAALSALQALSQEEKAAKAAKERRAKNKEQAFLFVKRDDASGLQDLLTALDNAEGDDATGPRWPDWKDHAGRTLWRCSQELRAARVQSVLKTLLGMQAPEEAKPHRRIEPPTALPVKAVIGNASVADTSGAAGETMAASPERSPVLHAQEDQRTPAASLRPPLPFLSSPPQKPTAPAPETTPEAPTPLNTGLLADSPSPEPIKNEAELRAKAFRAVVKDDTAALAEVVDEVPRRAWSRWQNKAGKDLLTLSEERGSSGAYSLLAKALGLLKERKREAFEEREAVWVLFPGEVQPRRATVMEDTLPEADEIMLEFWDGDEPASLIDRNFVLKACN